MPARFETIQYKARPLGKVKENTAIISGIIHSIMVWLPICLGSVEGTIVIFCCTQVETKTRTGMMILVGSGSDRSRPRNLGSSGAAAKVMAKGQKA